MQRFIFEVIEPFINKDLQEESRKEIVQKITYYTKDFIKGQLGPINKQLSKKSRQLFVATSDIETLKQKIQFLQNEMNKLRAQIGYKQSQIIKQKMSFQSEIDILNEQIKKLKKEIKQTIHKYQLEIQKINDQYKDKIFDMKKQHKNQLQTQLNTERTFWQNEVQSLKESNAQQKHTIITQNSKERSSIIKKYEQKIYKMKEQSQDFVENLTKELNGKIEKLKKINGELINKITIQETQSRHLNLQLQKEIGQHRLFQHQFKSTFRELQEHRRRADSQSNRLRQEYQETIIKLRKSEKQLTQRYKQLETLFKTTCQQKDKKYIDTVELMSTEHRIQVQSLQNNMMEEREIAITNIQIKKYEQMFKQTKKYERLSNSYEELKKNYDDIKSVYEKKIKDMTEEHENQLSNILSRKDYEYEISGQNAKREYNNLLTKFNLQIKSLKTQNEVNLQNVQKKAQQQKIAITNKLIGQYEGMLSDQRSNTQVQIKQKLLQFQRKGKAYEKRINQSQKRKLQLKVTIQRMKIQSQMKIESMMQVNQKLQQTVQDLHQRILQLQKTKSVLINDYEYQLLLLKNQIEKIKEDSIEKEDQLRANLNQKIIVKNKQIAKIAEKLKQETEELLKKNKDRVTAIEKQYEELKRVINQKTSLPEDIQALKTFHAAYLQKENELLKQKKKRQELQRELHSKDAIQKVFATKEAFKRLTVIDKFASTTAGGNFFNKKHGNLH